MENLKTLIRKKVLQLRDSMKVQEVNEKSSIIRGNVLKFDSLSTCSTVMCYMDFRNEVKTGDIIRYCIDSGKRVAVPSIERIEETRRRVMVPYGISNIDNGMQEGVYGILEPRKDMAEKLLPEDMDMVLVPGVVFDKKGNRIGFGAGYYDSFLSKTRKDCIKVGLAFDAQILDNIPVEEHDICMDFIISESGILRICQE